MGNAARNSTRRYDVLLAAKHCYIDLCSAWKHSDHVLMLGIGQVNATLKYERRNVILLKDSMKVTANREKGKGERGKWPLFEERLYVSTRLGGWAL
jgi:hypothetical protein